MRQHLRPDARERDLPDGGRRLAFLEPQRAGRQPQHRAPHGDGAGGDDEHVGAPGMQIGDILGKRREPGMVQPPAGAVDEERGADLQDDAAELADLRAHGCHSSWASTGSSSALASIDHGKERLQHLLHALSGGGGDHIRRSASQARFSRCELLLQRVLVEGIGLREGDDLGLLGKAVAIGLDLVANGLVGLARILAGALDQVQQHAAALHMAQEAVAEADALGGALDQAGNVGQHEFARYRRARRRGPDGAW